jgi:hypothetical protein
MGLGISGFNIGTAVGFGPGLPIIPDVTTYQLFNAILRTFFERQGFTNEATNWLNVVIEVHCHFNRVMAYDHRQ